MPRSPRIEPVRSLLETGERRYQAESSPSLRPRGLRLKKLRSRPPLKRLTSTNKFKFSVDDDINDNLDDDEEQGDDSRERKYLEGYQDALRDLVTQRKNKMMEAGGSISVPASTTTADLDEVVNQAAAESLEDERATQEGRAELTAEIEDNASVSSETSLQTMESLDLKARQEAINSTHPFGIKIWKPSVYKKIRSVAARAEEDIHDFDPRRPTGPIFLGIHLTNFLWSCTVGLFLYVVCLIGAVLVFVLTGFAWHKSLRPYVRLLLELGKYWLFPFGKFVLLNKDENYLYEDEMDGRSISEFHQWRLEEEGRLFFAPPRRMTNSESKPLLKDHKGRPWREAYTALGEGHSTGETAVADEQNGAAGEEDENNDIKVRFFGRGRWSFGRLLFYLFFYGILQPILYTIAAFCWLFVFTIPMFNLNSILCDHLRRRPLALKFEKEKEYYKKTSDPRQKKMYRNQSIILCTYRCCGLHYYKYTLGGTNIFFINLLLVVVFVILDYYLLKEGLQWKSWYTDSSFLFCGCLFSIIPLAYFIGQAVASISAQSSMGVGAVINAFFSTVVEIFLYCVALNQSKGKLVEGSMIGSILGGVLLLPGLSMCGGALKRKTQRYNPRSAGVSSTMLLFAMVTMFAPSLFYQLYGSYEIRCRDCVYKPSGKSEGCTTCQFIQPSLILDNLYYKVLRPFSLFVAVALFVAYVCGLYFTLKTHASLIWATNSHELAAQQVRKDSLIRSPSIISLDNQSKGPRLNRPEEQSEAATPRSGNMTPNQKSRTQALPKPFPLPRNPSVYKPKDDYLIEDEHDGGHDAPNWSNTRSYVILLGSTLLYAIIAEILVNNVDAVLSHYPINPKFLGLTVFALVPNTTEFVNAISFAVSGNVALSMEIGSAYALQVVLIQIPALVVYSIYKQFLSVDSIFPLIFPRWDVFATLVSIYLFTYIYAEGKSNYFKGVILILIYIVVLTGFYLDDVVASLEDGTSVQIIASLLSR